MSDTDQGAAPEQTDETPTTQGSTDAASVRGRAAGAPPTVDELAADAVPIDVGDLAADYVEGLLDIADLDGDIDIEDEHGRTTLVVSGGDLRLLSGAETVGALQELTRLAVQARTGEFARLTLDIGGSRDQRSRELAAFVAQAFDALHTGADRYELEPMSSYERKIVHDLAAEKGLESHSEGEGASRHIVLTSA